MRRPPPIVLLIAALAQLTLLGIVVVVSERQIAIRLAAESRVASAVSRSQLIVQAVREPIAMLDRQIVALERRMETLLASTRALATRKAILCSAPGTGPVTAAVLLAHLPELGHRDRRAISALAGLATLLV